MPYSVNPILHPYADKNNLHKVNIQVIYNKMKAYKPTTVKIPENNFEGGIVVKHPLKNKYNLIIKEECHRIEKTLIDTLHAGTVITKDRLTEIVKGVSKDEKIHSLAKFIEELHEQLYGKLSAGRLRHYKVMNGKVYDFDASVSLKDISVSWLNKFEAWLRKKGLDGNTVLSNMNLLIGVLNKGAAAGLLSKEQFAGYKRPKYDQKMSEYLSEEELEKLYNLVKIIEKPSHKLAGYYYLLSCYTGYRISDAKTFSYDKNMQGGALVLRAAKNKTIVSTPIFPRLGEILDFIKDKPLHLSEEKIRQYIKELFSLVGIKKDMSFHSSRHTYAMLLMRNGFTLDEVSHFIGDSALITKVYAKIENPEMHKKIMDKFGGSEKQ